MGLWLYLEPCSQAAEVPQTSNSHQDRSHEKAEQWPLIFKPKCPKLSVIVLPTKITLEIKE